MYLSLVCAWLQGGFVLSCCNLKVLLWKWKPLRWWPPETLWYGRPWGDCFQLQVSQQIIKVKIIAVQPQRMAGISLQEVWKSDSKSYFQLRICYYFKWIFFLIAVWSEEVIHRKDYTIAISFLQDLDVCDSAWKATINLNISWIWF